MSKRALTGMKSKMYSNGAAMAKTEAIVPILIAKLSSLLTFLI